MLRDVGSPHPVERADYTRQGGADALAALPDRHLDPDTVFAASDLMASGALQTLRERGRTVPEDVAVVGFDDLTSLAETTDPPLTLPGGISPPGPVPSAMWDHIPGAGPGIDTMSPWF